MSNQDLAAQRAAAARVRDAKNDTGPSDLEYIAHAAIQDRQVREIKPYRTTAPNGEDSFVRTYVVPAAASDRDKYLNRILDQCNIGDALSEHPHHVRLIQYTEENGVHRLYHTVAPGETITDLMEHNLLEISDVLTIAEDVASALVYAHNSERRNKFEDPIVHGDLSPSNVKYDGEVARIYDHGAGMFETPGEGDATTRGLTRGFGAPELLNMNANTASDVFSLGMLLHYMVTGEKSAKYFRWDNTWEHEKLIAAVENRTNDQRIVSLIEYCTKGDFNERPTAEYVVDKLREIRLGKPPVPELDALVESNLEISLSGNRDPWNVPEVEASLFAEGVIGTSGRDVQKLATLNDYLITQPVSERDKRVINIAIDMLEQGEYDVQINRRMRKLNREDPELIYGMGRKTIFEYGSIILNGSPPGKMSFGRIRQSKTLMNYIETVASSGYDPDHIVSLLNSLGRMRVWNTDEKEGKLIDRKNLTQVINDIEDGNRETEVEGLVFCDIDGQGMQALELIYRNADSSLSIDAKFGEGLLEKYRPSGGFGAIGAGLVSVPAGVYSALYAGLKLNSYLDPIIGNNLGTAVGVGAGIATAAIIGYSTFKLGEFFANGFNSLTTKIRKNKLDYANISQTYHYDQFIECLSDLMSTVPKEDLESVLETIGTLRQESGDLITPRKIVETIKLEYQQREADANIPNFVDSMEGVVDIAFAHHRESLLGQAKDDILGSAQPTEREDSLTSIILNSYPEHGDSGGSDILNSSILPLTEKITNSKPRTTGRHKRKKPLYVSYDFVSHKINFPGKYVTYEDLD
ncbi:protein kinase [archaeon]|jgi:serine/threonine protein kinase|nr:protein kinase [archaeon]MBT6761993.1 protein kinase [archaeon]MBT7930107.1 protein kinase [Candidatus Peregrinibacteria bacterium]